ncbi:InlB B-repeat-containing protein [Planococcus shixiaomingii]|uniref:InlB B-repeat-containing protein n=1 Tax=Planococcus shixiaomingii TaxID=3058393 RepID=UPI00261FE141|nr:fibronectin type III domain-containing protein [Planococcus sp. N022]WKA53984.1 fibronectin type III domain-containing protein [Planococcus sp. N022]
MLKKCLSIFMIMILLLGIAPTKFFSTGANAEESIGLQAEVPVGYIGIYSPEDLQKVRGNLSGKYIMMNDIDLTEATIEGGALYNNGAGWSPIGNATTPFVGIFDGNGYKITGLKMSLISDQIIYAGLFGYAKKAKIMNLGMEDSVIFAENTSMDSATSQVYAGGIVGYGYNLTVSNNYNAGNISAESVFSGYAGGIVGFIYTDYNVFSSISDSFNSGEVYAKTSTGGIVGEASRTNFRNVSNKGSISTKTGRYTGGIVGELTSTSSVVSASNLGEIQSGTNGGGIVGYLSSSSISDSYNEGQLTSTVSSSESGGIVGYVSGSSTLKNVYNTGAISSSASSTDGGGIAGTLGGNSSIVEAYNTGDINVQSYAAGIVGVLYTNTIISKSYNTGNMSGYIAGGISAWASNTTIQDSFNTGVVKARHVGGGILGMGTNSTIKNTYNSNMVVPGTYYSSATGGIAGNFEGVIENSLYFDKVQSGVGKGSADGTFKKTIGQLKDVSAYNGFDFSEIWKFDENSLFNFPSLSGLPSPEVEKNLDISISSLPVKTFYVQGEEFDLTGAKIRVMKTHGEDFEIDITKDMIISPDLSRSGNQTIKVAYEGLSTSFDIIVKAKYTVTFRDHDLRVLKTETVIAGNAATAPELPVREGYTFSGWSTDFSKVNSSLVVTAKYTINSYTIKYMDGETVLNSVVYRSDQQVAYPDHPVKSGYTFVSWYEDADFKKTYEYNNKLSEDKIVFARFSENLDAVQNFKVANAGFDKVKVTWNKVEGADGYVVYHEDSTNAGTSYGSHIGADEESHIVYGLKPNTTYYIRIHAYKIIDGHWVDGPTSQSISVKPVLLAATNVKAAPSGYDKATITWGISSEAYGYEVHRSTSATGTYSLVGTVTSDSKLSYTNNGLTPGKTYYYKVRAYGIASGGKKVYSAFSNSVSAKPELTTVSAKAIAAGYNKNKVSWSKVSGANGYVVYRATSKSGTYSTVKTITSGSLLSYENSGLTAGKTYYYKVRAYRTVSGKSAYGPYSSIVSAVPALASPLKLTTAKTSSTSIIASWSKVNEASGYELYRATSKSGTYTKVKTQTSGSSISYTNTSLSKGKTYYYKVRAYRTVSGKKIYSPYTTIVSTKL